MCQKLHDGREAVSYEESLLTRVLQVVLNPATRITFLFSVQMPNLLIEGVEKDF